MPNVFDQFDGAEKTAGGNPFDQFDGERSSPPGQPKQVYLDELDDPNNPLYRQRHGGSFVTGIIDGIGRAISTPREVYEGKIDLNTPEGQDRALEVGLTVSPARPSGLPRASATRSIVHKAPNEIATAAQELGINVPVGVATDNKALQAAMQRGRQVPGATGVIDKGLDEFYTSVFTRADDLAAQAGGGAARTSDEVGARIRTQLADEAGRIERQAADETGRAQKYADEYASRVETEARSQITAAEQAAQKARQEFDALMPEAPVGTKATVGDDLKASLEKRIQAHKEEQAKPYDTLRRTLIDPDAPVGVTDDLAGTLNSVMRERIAAAEGAIPRDLMPIVDIATNPRGVTFNGLQRARSTLAERIDFEEAQGFNAGDLKRAYGALTGAMRTVVQKSARNGASQAALKQFERAEVNFGSRADIISDLNGAVRNGAESLVERMIGYASERSGANMNKLRALQRELPSEDAAKVSRLAFQRLARDTKGEFSEVSLVKNWQAISPEGRRALFGERAVRIDQAIKNLTASSQQVKFTREVGDATIAAAQKDAKTNVAAATSSASAKAKEQSREVLTLLAKSDEQIVNEALRWASDGAGADLQKLVRMSTLFGKEGMDGLASISIQRLGVGRGREFSAAAFVTNWKSLSDSGRALLFRDAEIRKALDNMVRITERMAETQKRYGNSSGSGGAVGQIATGAGLFADPFTTISALVGANIGARLLTRPAVAKAANEYAKAAQAHAMRPSATTLKAVEQARARLLEIVEKGALLSANDNSAQRAVSGQ